MCLKYPQILVIMDAEGFDQITINAQHNALALMNDYRVRDPYMATLARRIRLTKVSPVDMGLSILMSKFAKCIAASQYPLFANTFAEIHEMSILINVLLQTNKCSLNSNLATDKKYGLFAQQNLFTNNGHLTKARFDLIWNLVKKSPIEKSVFVSAIKDLHISIIESFYMFSSYIKETSIIRECHHLAMKALPYNFQAPVKMCSYFGDYWFQLPKRAVWFATHNGRTKFSSIIQTREIYESLNKNALQRSLVLGYIADNIIYAYAIASPNEYSGNWPTTIATLQSAGFCVPYNVSVPPYNAKNVHFVKNDSPTLYKLITD